MPPAFPEASRCPFIPVDAMASTLGGYSKNNLLEAIAAGSDPGLL
jgi:hypothetical protein